MTWSTISNPAVAVGGIPSSTTVTALRDNPIAIAEATSGAPIVVSGWHPYNKLNVGDSNTGLIYDSAVDGTVSEVVTPDFEDGYDYRIIVVGLSHNNGSARALALRLFYEDSANYENAHETAAGSASVLFDMDAEIILPRLSRRGHLTKVMSAVNLVLGTSFAGITSAPSGFDEKVLKAEIRFAAGSVDAGKVWMFRRREYASSP